MPSERRFPPPWTIEERVESFIVHDATGQALGYFYFEDEPGSAQRRSCLASTRPGRGTSPSCRSCGGGMAESCGITASVLGAPDHTQARARSEAGTKQKPPSDHEALAKALNAALKPPHKEGDDGT